MTSRNVSGFYDDYVVEQQKVGINDRIYHLYKKMRLLGLHSRSNVLELGCGIGSLTYLLSRTIKGGQIEAVDISPKSIEYAKHRLNKPNINFYVHDIVRHVPHLSQFDFITLFDVIEHVPIDQHPALFRNLSGICGLNTTILINIPNPEYISYDMKYNATALQVIDQPLPLSLIINNFESNGLQVVLFETYSIWVENDYQFFTVRKKTPFRENKLHQNRTFFQKIAKRLQRSYIKLKYNYH